MNFVKQKLIDKGLLYESPLWADGFAPSEIGDKSPRMEAMRRNAQCADSYGYQGVSESGFKVFNTKENFEKYMSEFTVPIGTDKAGCIWHLCKTPYGNRLTLDGNLANRLFVNDEKKKFSIEWISHPFFNLNNMYLYGYRLVEVHSEQELRNAIKDYDEGSYE